jgi:hypothetical protein
MTGAFLGETQVEAGTLRPEESELPPEDGFH